MLESTLERMALFDRSIAGDPNPDDENDLALWGSVAGLAVLVVLWVTVGDSPLTRFLLAAPLIGLVVLIATHRIRQVRPDDDLPSLRPAATGTMSPRSRWEAARFRHGELARDYSPYLLDKSLQAHHPRLSNRGDPHTARFHASLDQANRLRTDIYPGEATGNRYADAVRQLAYDWEVARRSALD